MNNMMEKLSCILRPECIREKEPMSRHTTFRVGGPADFYVEPENAEQLAEVIRICRKFSVPYYILGNGSNLLIGDRGYRGVMIALGKNWSGVKAASGEEKAQGENELPIKMIPENTRSMCAGAGTLLSVVARQALSHSLTGMEFAAGIPGTVGGAVVMNAGAYGSEIKNVLRSVLVLTEDGQVKKIPADELELGYRTSCIPRCGYVVLEAEFELKTGDEALIRSRIDELSVQRKTKQPLEYPSAGSTFKRPEGYFAGKLIQNAGLRGFSVGGAQVSEKHCGFVINRGNATAADIMELCYQVKEKVLQQYGVELEMEVKILGEF